MIKIKNKELKKPIFQGGMGVGVSLSGLAGAVAKAGGAGTISAAQIGFLDPEFDKDPFEANLRAIKMERIGVFKDDISKRFLAIASPCPCSSASIPQAAPGVSTKQRIGR